MDDNKENQTGSIASNNPPEENQISFGEKIVRGKFNPSNCGNVNFFKDSTAQILNVIDENRDLEPRLAALAITAYEEACMWAVKLATAKM